MYFIHLAILYKFTIAYMHFGLVVSSVFQHGRRAVVFLTLYCKTVITDCADLSYDFLKLGQKCESIRL